MLTGTRKPALASWRALGTSVVLARRTAGWLTISSGGPARLMAQDGRVLRVAGWPVESECQPEEWAQ